MKTKLKLKSSLSPLVSPSIMSSRTLASSFLLLGSVALVGCQSTGTSLSNSGTADASQSIAKSALSAALQKQRRSSFSYHSNIEISNEQQLTSVDKTQLVAADSVESYCEETHDNAYAAIVAQAEAHELEVSAPQYESQRKALEKSYIGCNAAYRAWAANRTSDEEDYLYDEYGYEDSEVIIEGSNDEYVIESVNEDRGFESRGVEGATIVETSIIKSNRVNEQKGKSSSQNTSSSQNISPYYQQLFDEYDNKSTPLDIKKAQLLDSYLLKPLSINAQGVYQPMAGKFTMLMSAQYQARNNYTSVNQPIYVDFKTGNIYLWADNFALLTSEFADDKLGTQWQNKWLRLAIDDGSLPKGFGSAVIKAHFEALDRTYEAAPVAQFDYLAPTSLATLSPKLPTAQLNYMSTSATKQIVRRVQSAESYEQFYKDYISIFYELITNQYPELVKAKAAYEPGDPRPDANKLTSKVLVQQALAMMKKVTDRQADNLVNEVLSAAVRPDGEVVVDNSNQQPNIQLLYGLNQRGQIEWQHQRNQYVDSQKAAKGMTIDVLQQYLPVSSAVAFPNLPADMQTPNASNSVDVRKYGSELMQYYEEGNGTAIGKMLYSTLPMAKAMYSAVIEPEQYEEVVEENAE